MFTDRADKNILVYHKQFMFVKSHIAQEMRDRKVKVQTAQDEK